MFQFKWHETRHQGNFISYKLNKIVSKGKRNRVVAVKKDSPAGKYAPVIINNIPKIGNKDSQSTQERKAFALHSIHRNYPHERWASAITDGSATKATEWKQRRGDYPFQKATPVVIVLCMEISSLCNCATVKKCFKAYFERLSHFLGGAKQFPYPPH